MEPKITHQINLPDGAKSGRRILCPGEVIETHCSKCGHKTRHVYQPESYPVLVCLACHPERTR